MQSGEYVPLVRFLLVGQTDVVVGLSIADMKHLKSHRSPTGTGLEAKPCSTVKSHPIEFPGLNPALVRFATAELARLTLAICMCFI